jgi:hypothetical protein
MPLMVREIVCLTGCGLVSVLQWAHVSGHASTEGSVLDEFLSRVVCLIKAWSLNVSHCFIVETFYPAIFLSEGFTFPDTVGHVSLPWRCLH